MLRLNIVCDPPTLDPRRADDVTSTTVCLMLYEGLMRLNINHLPSFALAESVEVSPDERSYRVHLREAYWSHGTPITSLDFVETWKSSLEKTFPAPCASQLFIIDNAESYRKGLVPFDEVGLKALDAKTLEVRLVRPAPYFLSLLAHPIFFPLPEESRIQFSTNCVSGPFQLEQWIPKRELVVTTNPHFWDAGRVYLSGIRMTMVEQESTDLNLFERGELDWHGLPFCCPPLDAVPELQSSGRLISSPSASMYMYALNTQKPPLTNAKIRRALSLAIDRPQILNHVLKGIHRSANGMLPPPLAVHSKDLFGAGNSAEAQQLWDEGLQELGLDKTALAPLIITFNQAEDHLKIAQAVQQRWQEVLGVSVQLQENEWSVHLSQLAEGHFLIGRSLFLARFLDPIDFLNIFYTSEDSRNYSAWEDANYRRVIDALLAATDPSERIQLIAEGEMRLLEAMPVIPFFHINDVHLMNPHLQDVAHSPLGPVDFRWAYFQL